MAEWTRLPNHQAGAPDQPARYTPKSLFDALDGELGHSSVVDTLNLDSEQNEAVNTLLEQFPDLSSGSANDIEMSNDTILQPLVVAQLPGQEATRFEPEIGKTQTYRYNLMETKSEAEMMEVPGSPVTPQEDELLDLETGPDSALAKVVCTRRPSTVGSKKKFQGPEDLSRTEDSQ